MKKYTDEEIKSFFDELYKEEWKLPDVTVIQSETKVHVKVERMYEYVPVDFAYLKKIGEFFETDKVNGSDKDYYSGCETCDYGSSYYVNFVIEA